jgi:hypothetical protein
MGYTAVCEPHNAGRIMNTTARLGAVVLLVLSAACGSSGLTSSTGTSPTAALPLPTPPRTFSPLSGPSRTFIFDRELSYRVSAYTRESRFVLYDNGAFVLQYVGLGLEYRGGYTEENARMSSSGKAGAPPARGVRPALSKVIR